MTIADVKRIIKDQAGMLTPSDVTNLAEDVPNITLVVKMGYGMRFETTPANLRKDVAANIEYHRIRGIDQYVREVFIPATDHSLLEKVLGWV